MRKSSSIGDHSSPNVSQTATPVPPPSKPNHVTDTTRVQLQYQADRWNWKSSCIRDVKFNRTIQDWMNYDVAFANWVRTCVMQHADNGALESTCRIPDMWNSLIGESITIVSANGIPGERKGDTHEVKDGIYHVMC